MLEHHGKEVVKASVSSDNNKKKFLETVSRVFEKFRLIARS